MLLKAQRRVWDALRSFSILLHFFASRAFGGPRGHFSYYMEEGHLLETQEQTYIKLKVTFGDP